MQKVMEMVQLFLDLEKERKIVRSKYLSYLNKENGKGYSALAIAVYLGEHQIVELFMERGAAVYRKTDKSVNLLKIAFESESLKVMRFLLSFGLVNINKKTFEEYLNKHKDKQPLDEEELLQIQQLHEKNIKQYQAVPAYVSEEYRESQNRYIPSDVISLIVTFLVFKL